LEIKSTDQASVERALNIQYRLRRYCAKVCIWAQLFPKWLKQGESYVPLWKHSAGRIGDRI